MINLQEKAVKIQGKEYVLVKDRVLAFNAEYPNGAIHTVLLSDVMAETVVVKAIVTPNTREIERTFTGHSQAVIGQGLVNKTSALENAETSAVGRALAMMGIGVIDSVASADELHKATGGKDELLGKVVKQPAGNPDADKEALNALGL